MPITPSAPAHGLFGILRYRFNVNPPGQRVELGLNRHWYPDTVDMSIVAYCDWALSKLIAFPCNVYNIIP